MGSGGSAASSSAESRLHVRAQEGRDHPVRGGGSRCRMCHALRPGRPREGVFRSTSPPRSRMASPRASTRRRSRPDPSHHLVPGLVARGGEERLVRDHRNVAGRPSNLESSRGRHRRSQSASLAELQAHPFLDRLRVACPMSEIMRQRAAETAGAARSRPRGPGTRAAPSAWTSRRGGRRGRSHAQPPPATVLEPRARVRCR